MLLRAFRRRNKTNEINKIKNNQTLLRRYRLHKLFYLQFEEKLQSKLHFKLCKITQALTSKNKHFKTSKSKDKPNSLCLFLFVSVRQRVYLILMVVLALFIICTVKMASQHIYHEDSDKFQHPGKVEAFFLDRQEDNQFCSDGILDFLGCQSISYQHQSSQKPFNTTLPSYLFQDDFKSRNYFCPEEDEDQERRSQNLKINQAPQKPSTNLRKYQHIQTKLDVKKKRHKCKVGDRFQTKNLCKYLFTETANFLKMMISANELEQKEKEEVTRFLQKKNRINLLIFKELFQSKQLRSKCLQFYESNQFVSGIFKSRSDMKTKLTIMKYLQTIRRIAINKETIGWKK